MRKSSISLVVMALLSGCSVGPEYQQPDMQMNTVTASSGSRPELTDPTQPLENEWWQLYQDDNLNGLVKEALNANKELKVAEANLLKAQSVWEESKSRRLPSTDLSSGVTYGDATQIAGTPSGSASTEQWSTSASLSIGWESDLFGRVSKAIEAAKANEQMVAAVRDSVRVSVAAETTAAYLRACSYGHAINVQRQALNNRQKQLDLIDAQLAAGSITESERARSVAIIERNHAYLQQLKGQRETALLRLTALLGKMPAQMPDVAVACDEPPSLTARIPTGELQSILRQRPDLRAAERQLAADSAMVNVRMAELYPSVSIGATGSYIDNDLISSDESFSYFLGPLLSWRFPNVAETNARIAQAKAQAKASYAEFEQTVVDALAEVETALSQVATERKRYQSLKQSMMSFKRAYAIAQTRFDTGSSGLSEVLDRQSELLEAQTQLAQSLQTLNDYHVSLFKSFGGGWQHTKQTDDNNKEG